jgi:hypothetical protein
MTKPLFKGLDNRGTSSLSDESGRLARLKNHILGQAVDELEKGRLSLAKRTALNMLSQLAAYGLNCDNLLDDRFTKSFIKDWSFDFELQIINSVKVWTRIWNKRLNTLYDSKEDMSHADRMASISRSISTTSSVFWSSLKDAVSPKFVANSLICYAGLLLSASKSGVMTGREQSLHLLKTLIKSLSGSFDQVFLKEFERSDDVLQSIIVCLKDLSAMHPKEALLVSQKVHGLMKLTR